VDFGSVPPAQAFVSVDRTASRQPPCAKPPPVGCKAGRSTVSDFLRKDVKKRNMNAKHLLLFGIVLLTSCASQKTNTLVGYDYDKTKDKTDYFVFPYGSVSISGEWNRTSYNQTARQQFFQNSDSIIISVAFGPCNKYEFNADNSKKGFDFVTAFYEWDSEYFVNNYRLNQEKIESNEKNNYIIWRAFGENNNADWDTYFLFGEKNGFANSFAIMKTDNWTKEEKVNFLKEMYLGENYSE
jgi:hypothetical protein